MLTSADHSFLLHLTTTVYLVHKVLDVATIIFPLRTVQQLCTDSKMGCGVISLHSSSGELVLLFSNRCKCRSNFAEVVFTQLFISKGTEGIFILSHDCYADLQHYLSGVDT